MSVLSARSAISRASSRGSRTEASLAPTTTPVVSAPLSRRAIAESATEGFIKVLTRPGSDRILGVTIVGAHAGELLAEYVLAMTHGIGLKKLMGTIHVYPTFAEINKSAASAWRKKHAPEQLLAWVGRYHDARRD